MADSKDLTLSRELLEAQLSVVELIRAMYPPPEEGETDSAADEVIDRVRAWCECSDTSPAEGTRLPSTFGLAVTIPVHIEDDSPAPAPPVQIEMSVTVPLSSTEGGLALALAEPPPLTYSLRQPSWMSRAQVAELGGRMPMDDILAAFDYIQDNAPGYYHQHQQHRQQQYHHQEPSQISEDGGPLLRVWFYFPSLSTREKRKDLVSYAAGYGLTGFVLAGKPGVLCLEGTSGNVDGYMNAIKNESWGDIPSHQKKVSERFREECGAGGRRFEGMREITDDLGERRGARKNRGDMAALEAWLKEMGVGESFSRVIMGG